MHVLMRQALPLTPLRLPAPPLPLLGHRPSEGAGVVVVRSMPRASLWPLLALSGPLRMHTPGHPPPSVERPCTALIVWRNPEDILRLGPVAQLPTLAVMFNPLQDNLARPSHANSSHCTAVVPWRSAPLVVVPPPARPLHQLARMAAAPGMRRAVSVPRRVLPAQAEGLTCSPAQSSTASLASAPVRIDGPLPAGIKAGLCMGKSQVEDGLTVDWASPGVPLAVAQATPQRRTDGASREVPSADGKSRPVEDVGTVSCADSVVLVNARTTASRERCASSAAQDFFVEPFMRMWQVCRRFFTG